MENRSIQESGEVEFSQEARPIIRTQFNPSYEGEEGEVNTLPSKTVPDQAMSVREIMDRAARGTLGDVVNHGEEYYEDLIIPQGLDLVELHERREELEYQLKKYQDEIEKNSRSGTDVDTDSTPDPGERGKGKTDPPTELEE